MGLSATEQIQKQVDKSLEPKLEKLLARKVKTTALKTKPKKKDQHYKFNPKEQFAKKESHARDHSVNTESTLAKFAKQKLGKELSSSEKKMSDSDMDDRKPSGKDDIISLVGKAFSSKKVIANHFLIRLLIVMLWIMLQCMSSRIRSSRSKYITSRKVLNQIWILFGCYR